jgi:hypothetical protein
MTHEVLIKRSAGRIKMSEWGDNKGSLLGPYSMYIKNESIF